MKHWPRWHFSKRKWVSDVVTVGHGTYRITEFHRSYNEGWFPNFCIQWERNKYLFVYCAIAPGLRVHFCIGKMFS